jgi:CheY-like chemotaxis protein
MGVSSGTGNSFSHGERQGVNGMAPSDIGRRPVVLVVDDDFDIREALQEILQDVGYDVSQAHNGAEAWAHLQQNPRPDVILLDLFMPIMTGQELLARLRSDHDLRAIPIIVMSASPHAEIDPSVPRLQKPMPVGRLLDLLEKFAPLERRRLTGT